MMALLVSRADGIGRFVLCLGLLLCLGAGFLCPGPAHGQSVGEGDAEADSARSAPAGRLVYFKGTVTVKAQGNWTPAQIDQSLNPAVHIATASDAEAEIKWPGGGRSTLGPADTQRVGDLYAQVRAASSPEAMGLLERFRKLFTERTETVDDPGALRRGAGTPFEQAVALYRDRQFEDALPLFRQVLADSTAQATTGPSVDSSKAALARFALAHCYLDAGRRAKARTILQTLIDRHPSDRTAAMARRLLDTL